MMDVVAFSTILTSIQLELVRNIHLNCTKDRDFLTSVRGELCRRRKEWASSVTGPEPVVCLLAHDRQGRTCVHFHGGVNMTKSYRNFYRLGSLCRRIVQSVRCVIIGFARIRRLELVILGFSPTTRCRFLVTGILAADRGKVT